MSESRQVTLRANIIHKDTKEVVDCVERTLAFFKEIPEDYTGEVKTLDDIINDFIQSIQEICVENKVEVLNIEAVYDELAIGFVLSSKLRDEQESELTVDVFVTHVPTEKEKEVKKDGQIQ